MADNNSSGNAALERCGWRYGAVSGEICSQSGMNGAQLIVALLQMVFLLFSTVLELLAVIIELVCLLKKRDDENRDLYERAHLGSDTSGMPPNKDWKRNGAPTETGGATDAGDGQNAGNCRETPSSITDYLKNRGGGKRRRGGQKNHPPSFMRVAGAQEREPVMHYPDTCVRCSNFEQCKADGKFRKYSTSHGYDVEVTLVHREHWQYEATDCMRDGSAIHEDFPEIVGAQYYEANMQLHVLTWHHLFHGSYEQIGTAAKELFGLSLSAGTANAIVKRVGSMILESRFMDALRFFILIFDRVMGADETSARVGGRNAWVHTAVTSNVTLLTAHWSRGYEGAIYSGVLQFFRHTLISDCWAPYFNEELQCGHAICDGHILRELVAAAYFRGQGWAIDMFDLLLEMYNEKEDAIGRGEKCLQEAYIDGARTRYREIVADGFAGIAGETKGKTVSLLERLQKLEDAAIAFAVDFDVDFTNNASEISLRNLKVAMRVAGQFQTMSGLGDYCIIQSFMDTCRKQGRNPFDMLRVVLSGGDVIAAVFDAGKADVLKQVVGLTDEANGKSADENRAALSSICPNEMAEELLAAVLHRRYNVCERPPPEKKSPASPKDKMQEARKLEELKKSSRSQSGCTQNAEPYQAVG